MTSMNDRQFFVPAWGVSLALHGVVVGLAFVFSAQVKPILQENVFKWDVALVQESTPDSVPTQVQTAVTPVQPTTKVVPPSRTKRVTEVSQVVRPLEQNSATPPIEQNVEVPLVRKELMEQRIVETVTPVAEPTVEANMVEPVPPAASPEPTESQSIQQEPTAIASAPAVPSEGLIPQEKALDAVATPGPVAKTDNRWLAESLWRRVAELKRYPSLARMNGQEGKVIVKAVIRSDGQLADVFVQKSSGYEALDIAAMEAVKLACPLHMKHAIGKPQIVVSLPIVYSLAN